jgi:antitoxin component of MazEF toxin-antitoxin module
MKLRIRRVGNSLGVIIPKHVLDQWALAEGASVDLTSDGIFFDAGRAARSSHPVTDESLWADKRRRQARDLAAGESRPIFSEEMARRAVIDDSPL